MLNVFREPFFPRLLRCFKLLVLHVSNKIFDVDGDVIVYTI